MVDINQRATTCTHFNGTRNDCCEAGVNYARLGDDSKPGMALRLPCNPLSTLHDRPGFPMVTCHLYEATGLEQATKDEREINEHMTYVGQAIVTIGAQPGEGGHFPCPKCGSKFTWAKYGKRSVMASCETDDCIRWM